MSDSTEPTPTDGGDPPAPINSATGEGEAKEEDPKMQEALDAVSPEEEGEGTTEEGDEEEDKEDEDKEDEDKEDEDNDEQQEIEAADGEMEEAVDGNDDEEEDMMAMLPERVRHRVDRLKDLNSQRDTIMEEYLVERAALENKFGELCKPLYAQRLDIIKGVMDTAIASVKTTSSVEEEENIVGVPQFWVCAMGHMETVAELVTEQDVDCLEHLTNVTCVDFEDGKGFTLNFYFEPNDYFENDVLTKKYEIPNLLLDDEPILKNVSGCVINWKENKTLTHTQVRKKQRSKRGKNAGQIRTITRNERTDSFFHFFNPPKMPSMEDMDEEEADAIEEAFDHDYDVAQAFRSHLVPKSVLWFTGEALDEDLTELTGEMEKMAVEDAEADPDAEVEE